MSSVARKYRGRPPKSKDEDLFEDASIPQSPSMNAYQFIEMKETTAEPAESLEHPESTESQSVQLYDFGGATSNPIENDENAFDLGNNNEESQLQPVKKERRGRKKIDKSQMAISKVIRVSRKRIGRPPGSKGSRRRGRWPAKAAVEIPAVVEASSADISLQNLLFNADSLTQMGGEVLFASKLGAEWNVHPSRLLAKLDRFSVANLGMKFEELLRFVDKMTLIDESKTRTTATFDDFLNENVVNKRKILSQWLLELYCAQCQKECEQIPWNNVTITGWPPGVYKNLNYVSVLDLNLIFEAYKRSEIIFTVNN